MAGRILKMLGSNFCCWCLSTLKPVDLNSFRLQFVCNFSVNSILCQFPGAPPLLSKTDQMPPQQPKDPNELDSGLNDLLKRSFEYIKTRQAGSNENQKVESREPQTKTWNDSAATNQPPPKNRTSNLNDLLHRLKVEKQENYLKNVEKNQLFRQQRMQADSAGGATAQSPNFLGDIMSAQNSMFVPKKPESSDGKPFQPIV